MAVAVLLAGGKSGTIRIILATYLINSSQVAFFHQLRYWYVQYRAIRGGRRRRISGDGVHVLLISFFSFFHFHFHFSFYFSCRISSLRVRFRFLLQLSHERFVGVERQGVKKGLYGYGTVVICRSEIPLKSLANGLTLTEYASREGLGLKCKITSLAPLIACLSHNQWGRIQKEALSHAPSFSLCCSFCGLLFKICILSFFLFPSLFFIYLSFDTQQQKRATGVFHRVKRLIN